MLQNLFKLQDLCKKFSRGKQSIKGGISLKRRMGRNIVWCVSYKRQMKNSTSVLLFVHFTNIFHRSLFLVSGNLDIKKKKKRTLHNPSIVFPISEKPSAL